LEKIFDLGDDQVKAAAVVSMAILGRSHNRWFVMERLLRLCGPTLDDMTAERIGIEIQVDEVQAEFIDCAEVIHRSTNDYHERIARRLLQDNE
jgi:hypothetical protein